MYITFTVYSFVVSSYSEYLFLTILLSSGVKAVLWPADHRLTNEVHRTDPQSTLSFPLPNQENGLRVSVGQPLDRLNTRSATKCSTSKAALSLLT